MIIGVGWGNETEFEAVMAMNVGFISLPSTIAALTYGHKALFTALQIWVAPKVYLIEYASQLGQ